MKTAIVIPARFGSTRLPAKPLLKETGKYLIQHVYERACQSHADAVIVATDDDRIVQACRLFGANVVVTSADHQSGTDRVAEVAGRLGADIIVNLQGDEPMMEPDYLDLVTDHLLAFPSAAMATLATPIRTLEQWRDPSWVKVVRDDAGRALYFSRSPIPYVRDGEPVFGERQTTFLAHIGLYAYRREFLLEFAASRPHPLECYEKLEQLRAMALGKEIRVAVVPTGAKGVDTPEDYAQFVQMYRQQTSREAA